MAVKKVEQTTEEKTTEEKDVQEKTKKVTEDVLSSLELPKEEKVEETEKEEEEVEGTEEEVEEETEEKGEKEDEDLIPRSKVEKSLKRMEKRIEKLARENRSLKTKQSQPADTRDPDMVKLEAKSIGELKELKKNVRMRQLKAQNEEGKEDELEKLLDLETKIDEVVTSAPQRFYRKQIDLYNEKVDEVYDDPDIEDIDKAVPELKKLAGEIYNKYPRLQRSVEGQAMALGFAVDHYKVLQKHHSGKTREKELKRANTNLKRKTALDTGKLKCGSDKVMVDKLRKKAFRGGTVQDKEALVLHDPRFNIDALIPDEYKGE